MIVKNLICKKVNNDLEERIYVKMYFSLFFWVKENYLIRVIFFFV